MARHHDNQRNPEGSQQMAEEVERPEEQAGFETEGEAQASRRSASAERDTLRGTAKAMRQAAARESIVPDLGTAVVVGAAVTAIESELLPGVLIGAGALLARRLLPVVGLALRPVVRSAVRAGYGVYAAGRDIVAEATEQVEDMVAEARSEQRRGRPGESAAAAP